MTLSPKCLCPSMLDCTAKETDIGEGIRLPLWLTRGRSSGLFGGPTVITVMLHRVEETQEIRIVARHEEGATCHG